jgi:hypothetical protein
MPEHPRCADCDRAASDWIQVGDAHWEPNLREVRPDTWKCWECRGEAHPDMRDDLISQLETAS